MSNPIQGSSRILQALFTDENGNPVDPDVTLHIRDPLGTITSPTPDNPAVGTYEYELDLDLAGWWDWEYQGSSVEGSESCSGKICVDASVFAVIS